MIADVDAVASLTFPAVRARFRATLDPIRRTEARSVVSSQDLEAGVLREMTGSAVWRAFAVS
jgi:hypothetical protein